MLLVRVPVTVIAVAAVVALMSSSPTSAAPPGGPTLTKTNDADHDGSFHAAETVPANASYPYTVTYQLSVFGGTENGPNGPYHDINSVSDNRAPDIGACAGLVGTIAVGQTLTCTYDVTFASPSATPVVNTAHIGYDNLGNDVLTSRSTVSFQSPSCAPKPPKVNLRWHYSANGTSGSWSGTATVPCGTAVTLGPQAMEGNLKVTPGTVLKAGYSFTLPGNKAPWTVTVAGGGVTFGVKCVSGATPSQPSFAVALPYQSYAVGPDSNWYPSGNQSSPSVYQGSIAVPDLCSGGAMSLSRGGTFTATVTAS